MSGGLLLLLGAAFLKLAFYVGDCPGNPLIFRLTSWLIGFLAILSIGQGVWLLAQFDNVYESKAAYITTFNGATGAFRSPGIKL